MARKFSLIGFVERKAPYGAPRSRDHGMKVAPAKRIRSGPDVYASDELIAERRAEAAKEADEARRWLRERKKKRR